MRRKRIILNEFLEAEKILSKGFFTNGISNSELILLAKYYKSQKTKPKQIKQRLIDFCKNNDDFFNLEIHEKMINNAVNKSKLYKMKSVQGINIPVFQEEIDRIKNLPHQLYKILFVMLVMARYQKYSMNKIKESKRKKFIYYLNNVAFEDICSMSGMGNGNISKNKLNTLKYELDGKGGFISANLFSENSWLIRFAKNDGKVIALVRDLENILNYIPYYCVNCGNQIEKRGKRDKCDNCYKEHRKKVIAENAKKYRDSVRIQM